MFLVEIDERQKHIERIQQRMKPGGVIARRRWQILRPRQTHHARALAHQHRSPSDQDEQH
jgi:hypothetical protein